MDDCKHRLMSVFDEMYTNYNSMKPKNNRASGVQLRHKFDSCKSQFNKISDLLCDKLSEKKKCKLMFFNKKEQLCV